jgi:hypothetical protein
VDWGIFFTYWMDYSKHIESNKPSRIYPLIFTNQTINYRLFLVITLAFFQNTTQSFNIEPIHLASTSTWLKPPQRFLNSNKQNIYFLEVWQNIAQAIMHVYELHIKVNRCLHHIQQWHHCWASAMLLRLAVTVVQGINELPGPVVLLQYVSMSQRTGKYASFIYKAITVTKYYKV